jgi:hypothetical protein
MSIKAGMTAKGGKISRHRLCCVWSLVTGLSFSKEETSARGKGKGKSLTRQAVGQGVRTELTVRCILLESMNSVDWSEALFDLVEDCRGEEHRDLQA